MPTPSSAAGAPGGVPAAGAPSAADSARTQQLVEMLIEQQRDKERKRAEELKSAAVERAKHPIWERDAAWQERKRANLVKLTADSMDKAHGGCSFKPAINKKSRELAQNRKVRAPGDAVAPTKAAAAAAQRS
jgi:hypothetical protein